jgi:hypothetical protein
MPLEPGKTATVWLLAPGTTGFAAVKAAVLGTERITVPAGAFDCYKVRLTADSAAGVPAPSLSTAAPDRPWANEGETLWYGQGGVRPLVRIEFGAARGELTSLSAGDPQGTRSYRDVSAGFSFTLPPGWIYHARNAIAKEGSSVDLIDPESQTVVIIAGRSKHTDPAAIDAEIEKGAETRMAGVPHQDTWSRIGGHRALTRAGGRDGRTSRVSWITWVQSEATRLSIAFQTDKADFDSVLRRLQPILDSFRMP